MSDDAPTEWGLLKVSEQQMRTASWALFGLAAVAAIASFWAHDLTWMATIFALLAMHASSIAHFCRRLADKQAALDMKKIMFDARVTKVLHVSPDDTINFQAGATIRVSHYTTIEVM